MKPTRKNIFLLSLATLLGFSMLGLGSLFLLQDISAYDLLHNGTSLADQLLRGAGFGLSAFLLALFLLNTSALKGSGDVITKMIKELKPTIIEVAFYSLCAGIGEELLFRGGIQPLFEDVHLGVWVTSVIFIVLHGYINPMDWRMSLYGLLMVGISAGIGYLLIMSGLYASIMAHFLFDFLMFMYIMYGPEETTEELTPE